jgi:hypothetical protein
MVFILLGGMWYFTSGSAPAEATKPQRVAAATAALELFAREDFYKNLPSQEQTFVGKLTRVEKEGQVGFGRFNPYRLVMKDDTREVYVGARGNVLLPFVGKQVRIVGKPVDLEVEGKNHREIWPARLEIVLDDKPSPKEEKGPAAPAAADPDKGEEVKVLGRAFLSGKISTERPYPGPRQEVIRSEEELQRLVGKEGVERLAKQLKVEAIDYKKHMLVHVTGGVHPTGGYRVEITGVKKDGKAGTLNVHWKLHTPRLGGAVTQAFTHPGELLLLERFEGDVRFVREAVAPDPKK